MFVIKVKANDEKRWSFLTARGGTNYLKIHAGRFDSAEKAQRVIDENSADNPNFEWKVVSFA